MMRFYKEQHAFYCGVDLHAKTMHICLVNQAGEVLVHRNLPTHPDRFLAAVAPYHKQDLVVGVECMFTWYWLGDLCAAQKIPFVLGHALYMKAIHGGKTKNDRVDSEKIAMLLRGGMLPQGYVYPHKMRATRDLLRRRMYLVHHRAEALAHIENTRTQYNRPAFEKRLSYAANRTDVAAHFDEPSVRRSVEVDLALIDHFDEQIRALELYLEKAAKFHDPRSFYLLRSTPGIGKILALTMLYEIHDVRRFSRVGRFLSYARLVKCPHESSGKRCGAGGRKIGNAHLKWAFSEAACLMLRSCPPVKAWMQRQEKKRGKRVALSILEAKIGRAVYHLWRKQVPFDVQRFLNG
jgi:transposase